MRFKLAATVAVVAALVAATGVVASSASAARQGPGDIARTRFGVLEGVTSGDVVRFLGVPYAAPPTGALRWQSPRAPAHWTGVRRATNSGPPCAQGPGVPDASEDCLYLGITVPHGAGSATRRPVMVFLHGGGFDSGTGSDYNPTRMAEQGGVIVVTVDFRLGIYGFFGHRGLPGSGTFGLQDQQAALRWVKDDIGAFGGDPKDVTLFGESGGSVATCAQL